MPYEEAEILSPKLKQPHASQKNLKSPASKQPARPRQPDA